MAQVFEDWLARSAGDIETLVDGLVQRINAYVADPASLQGAARDVFGPFVAFLFDSMRDSLLLASTLLKDHTWRNESFRFHCSSFYISDRNLPGTTSRKDNLIKSNLYSQE